MRFIHSSSLILILLLVAPLGVAAQNVAIALSVLVLVFSFRPGIIQPQHIQTSKALRRCFFCFLLFLASMSISILLDAEIPRFRIIEYLLGYLPMISLSYAFWCYDSAHGSPTTISAKNLSLVLISFVAIIAASQMLLGWQRSGFIAISGEFRARGFYSHPLSLAYVALLVFPYSLFQLHAATNESVKKSWLFFFSTLLIIWTSKSRIVQILAVGFLSLFSLVYLRNRIRLLVLAALACAIAVIALTNNPVSRNFRETLAGKADRHTNAYADDRIAFWHAHWEMFKARPFFGYGTHHPNKFRVKAYEKIGLRDFDKKYAAHNTFLQILVDGGLVGLFFFLIFVIQLLIFFNSASVSGDLRRCATSTTFLFLFGCLTQNAFQDFEVRYVATLLLCIFIMQVKSEKFLS